MKVNPVNGADCGAGSGTPQRHLKPRQKAQVRKIREAKGVRTAIQRARELSKA